jgi:hypothetical protein
MYIEEFLRQFPSERQNGGMADFLGQEDFSAYQTQGLEL